MLKAVVDEGKLLRGEHASAPEGGSVRTGSKDVVLPEALVLCHGGVEAMHHVVSLCRAAEAPAP